MSDKDDEPIGKLLDIVVGILAMVFLYRLFKNAAAPKKPDPTKRP